MDTVSLKKYLFRSVFICLALFISSQANTFYAAPGKDQGYRVFDGANILSPQEEELLDILIQDYEGYTSAQIGIFTKKKMEEGETIEAWALHTFNEKGIGLKGVNNGIGIFLAMEDRKIRVEAGLGMEWVLTDDEAAKVIALLTPYLRDKKYADGLLEALIEITGITAKADWKVHYHSLKEAAAAGDTATGQIVAFAPGQIRKQEARLLLTQPGGLQAEVLFHPVHHRELVSRISASSILYGRVVAADPLQLQLTGLQ